jgi:hypothetical protein
MSKHTDNGKPASAKKIIANQQNAQQSTGPKDTSLTRSNALKHGLRNEVLTELDRAEDFLLLLENLNRDTQPVGVMEQLCVQQIADCMCRLARAKLLEREEFTAQLHPARFVQHTGSLTELDPKVFGWTETIDPGKPARISPDALDRINRTVVRYETSIENKLMRWWNMLERQQARRRGELIPLPAAVDVNVHENGQGVGSFGNVDEP